MLFDRCSLFLLFILLPAFLLAQGEGGDSLKKMLNLVKHEDTSSVNLLNDLAKKNLRTNPTASIDYANKALILSEKLNFIKGISLALSCLGAANYYLGNYNTAVKYFLRILKTDERNNYKNGIASSLNWLGNIYSEQANYKKAEECYSRGLKINEDMGHKIGISECLSNLGIILGAQGKVQQALDYFQQSLIIDDQLHDKRGMAITYNSIGNVYNAQNEYDKALKYFSFAIKKFEELKDKEGIGTILSNMGVIYQYKNHYDKAIDNFNKALKIFKELGFKHGSLDCNLGLSESYSAIKLYKKAYQYHKLYSEIKDSLFNEESSKQISEMQTKYETEKKEQQIKLLNKDKEIQSKDLQRQKTIRNAVVGFLLLVIGFLFVLINRFVLIRKQKKIIETEREKSENLLLNILPKDTAEELKLTGKAQPKSYEMVTVMFTDFKGFTTLAEKMSAEELVSELDFIFIKFDEIISKYPIEKIKTIGDSYMCAGGLPIANTTNPMDIVHAALDIQTFMLEQNKWQLRIGIHTGPVIAGVVGDKKFAYDIWGDTVNTASRMESSGEAGKVNISENTYQLIKDHFKCMFRGEVEAKHKGKIKMYFVEKN